MDAPVQIGGGGSKDGPHARLSSNTNRNTPPFAVEADPAQTKEGAYKRPREEDERYVSDDGAV